MPVKFLIVRFSSIGDIVLTTPVIRCLKQQLEGAEVHFLTKKKYTPVIKANPHIDQIHEFESFVKTKRRLKQLGLHYIIDLHNNLRSALVKSLLPAIPFSFKKLNIEKWLLVNFGKDRLPAVHIVDRYIDTLKLFDVVNDNKGLDHFIPTQDEINIKDLAPPFHNGYLVFAIGANHATKRLPPEKIADICRKIKLPVILAGGKDDAAAAEVISKGCGNLVMNACGKYNINQSASVIRQARMVLSHDTGLMHIAAAFKKKIISIWGNTIPRFGMSPYMAHPGSVVFEIEGLNCRPCSKLGFSKCPKKHFRCMEDQDSNKIAAYAREMYTGNQSQM